MVGLARLESGILRDRMCTDQPGYGANQQPSSCHAHSLLSLLAEGVGRNAALLGAAPAARSHVSGGACSLLFEPHPATGHLHVTSGAGIDVLPIGSWHPAGRRRRRCLPRSFAKRVAVAVPHLSEQMPQLHDRCSERATRILLPLDDDSRRFGLLAVGMPSHACQTAPARFRTATYLPASCWRSNSLGFGSAKNSSATSAICSNSFADQLAATLDLAHALEPLCVASTRLFAADRTTVWLYDRESRSARAARSSSDVSYPATRSVGAQPTIRSLPRRLRCGR